MNTQTITLKEFFSDAVGNIADYPMILPAEYIRYDVPTSVSPQLTFLWGTPEDIKTATADPSTINFDNVSSGIFRVRFTPNVGNDATGHLIDNTGTPLTKDTYTAQGLENIDFKSGSFMGLQGVPVVVISGEMKGLHSRMLYASIPPSEVAMLANMQGGKDEALNQAMWDAFVAGFKIQ